MRQSVARIVLASVAVASGTLGGDATSRPLPAPARSSAEAPGPTVLRLASRDVPGASGVEPRLAAAARSSPGAPRVALVRTRVGVSPRESASLEAAGVRILTAFPHRFFAVRL